MKTRRMSLDLLRIFATLGVISIHSDQITERMNYFSGISWWFTNIIHSISSVSVPLFFIISGYLLINPKNIKSDVKKTFTRIIIPLLFWTFIYIPWKYKWHGEIPNLKHLLTGSYHHLYFLTILAVLYFFKPKIEYFIKSNKDKLGRFILYGFLISMGISAISYFILNINPTNNTLLVSSTYIPYFVMGYWIRDKKITNKSFIIPTIITTMLISASSYLSYKNELMGNSIFILDSGANYFWEAFNPLVITNSLLIFVSFISFFKNKSGKFIANISSATYGIYLIHPIIIDLIDHYFYFAIHLVTGNLWFHLLKKMFVVFTVSLTTTLLLQKTWVGEKIFGETKKASTKTRN